MRGQLGSLALSFVTHVMLNDDFIGLGYDIHLSLGFSYNTTQHFGSNYKESGTSVHGPWVPKECFG